MHHMRDPEPQYSRKELFQRSLALAALVFRAGCAVLIAGQFQIPGQKRRIHLQNLRGQPDGFSWLVLSRAEFGSAQNSQLIEEFFARTELLASAGVYKSFVFVGQKKKPRYNHVVLCSCAGVLLLAVPSSPRQFLHLDYASNVACLPEVFSN